MAAIGQKLKFIWFHLIMRTSNRSFFKRHSVAHLQPVFFIRPLGCPLATGLFFIRPSVAQPATGLDKMFRQFKSLGLVVGF